MANFPCSLLSSLNLLLLLLSSSSFAPLLAIRAPPSSFGWALFATSSTTLLSSLIGSYSHLDHHHHHRSSIIIIITHISLLVISSIGQALAFFSLFLCRDSSLRLLGSEGRRSTVLMMVEACAMVGMFVVGSVVLLGESWEVREFDDGEVVAVVVEEEGKRKGLKGRAARVRVESVVESSGEMVDEKMKSKCEEFIMCEEV